jgi:hypothetical protein
MLEGDAEVQARAARVEELLRQVCGEDELPYFVSDMATLLDVCTLAPEEIAERLSSRYGKKVQTKDLLVSIWKLVDWLETANS